MIVTYDLKSVKMPRLAGGSLSLVASLLENGVVGGGLGNKLAKDTGIGILRRATPEESPTFPARGGRS